MTIQLRDITRDNWLDCISLKVASEQEEFVASNLFSLAQASFDPCVPLGVYDGGTMMGFLMYGTDPDIDPRRGSYVIYRLMIDRKYQGRGFGRAAMQEVLRRLRVLPDCQDVLVGFKPGNTRAEQLYRSLGFQDSDLQWPGETVLRYKF